MVVVSPVEEVVVGGSQRVAVDCQGEGAGMETRGQACRAVGVLGHRQSQMFLYLLGRSS